MTKFVAKDRRSLRYLSEKILILSQNTCCITYLLFVSVLQYLSLREIFFYEDYCQWYHENTRKYVLNRFPADLVTFTGEVLNRKLHYLRRSVALVWTLTAWLEEKILLSPQYHIMSRKVSLYRKQALEYLSITRIDKKK